MTKKFDPFSPENRIRIDTNRRVNRRLVEYDLVAVEEFHEHTALYFQKKIDALETKAAERPDSYWEEDVGGITRAEWESEKLQELKTLAQTNTRFGILGVFGAFERFLLRIHQDMMYENLVHQQFKRDYLKFDGYKRSLKKIGIRLTHWVNLGKLHVFRNAITHQDGFVTEENLDDLRPYGYKKVGQPIEITETYFQDSLNLVRQSSDEIVSQYSAVLSTTTQRGHRKAVPLLAAGSLIAGIIALIWVGRK